ncbi:hypothetical protein M9Y10_008374 [Tritrichomonas musculus]|uniref:Nascent polypeptide-associated complex subunit alpha-like UBA domain-containing protein n=1 Tax=Tritrichomonas musculus TaxID=1915356 RepID=A0ABR2IYV9_9EUKA
MSRQVEQHTTLNQNDSESVIASDENAKALASKINAQEAQPAIQIKESELSFLTKQCLIDRNQAFELMQSAKGNLEEALLLYVHQ